jgi:hypothetical protein
MLSESYGEDADFHVVSFADLLGTRLDGGAGSDDIIYEEDVATINGFGIDKAEHVGYIICSVVCRHGGLAFAERCTLHNVRSNGNAGHHTDTLCQYLALIISTPTLSLLGKRERHKQVDIIEKA